MIRFFSSSHSSLKYSTEFPPVNIPDVDKITHGSLLSSNLRLCSLFVTLLNTSDVNGFSPAWNICFCNSLLKNSGCAVCIAVASHIIPSKYTGTLPKIPLLINSSRTIIISCARPTANTGISIFPPF